MTLPADVRAWSPDAREEYEERAALIEVLGKVPRARAEREAEACVRRRYQAQPAAPGRAFSSRPAYRTP